MQVAQSRNPGASLRAADPTRERKKHLNWKNKGNLDMHLVLGTRIQQNTLVWFSLAASGRDKNCLNQPSFLIPRSVEVLTFAPHETIQFNSNKQLNFDVPVEQDEACACACLSEIIQTNSGPHARCESEIHVSKHTRFCETMPRIEASRRLFLPENIK